MLLTLIANLQRGVQTKPPPHGLPDILIESLHRPSACPALELDGGAFLGGSIGNLVQVWTWQLRWILVRLVQGAQNKPEMGRWKRPSEPCLVV